MRNVILPALAAGARAASAALAPAANAPAAHASTRARALAIEVVVAGGAGETVGLVDVRSGRDAAAGSFAVGGAGLATVADASVLVDASQTGLRGGAEAVVSTGPVSLLGGLVTASSIRVRATASSRPGSADGGARADIRDLIIAGQPVEATPNAVVALPAVGTVTLAETVDAVRGPSGHRGFVTALHLRLTTAAAGFAKGTEVLVGYADAGAASPRAAIDPKPKPKPTPTPVAPPAAAVPVPGFGSNLGRDTDSTEAPPPGGFVLDPPIAPPVRAQLLSAGYVFPVVGGAGFSNDFGGPRADTGFHQGLDLFAANGTPLVAVHDGTLFRVGWNRLGGNRLWLDDGHGNLFYYAHLSGYSDIAADGAKVTAGQVVGFIGDSGDAQGTPYHLHFEMHPAGGWAVPPIEYVRAWQAATPGLVTSSGVPRQGAAVATAPEGASLVEAADISGTSGLDDAALARFDGAGESGTPVNEPDPAVVIGAAGATGFTGLR